MIRITDGKENGTRNTALSRKPDGKEDPRTLAEVLEMMK